MMEIFCEKLRKDARESVENMQWLNMESIEWLLSDTPKGAAASANVYSMVETAKANDVDVYLYLKYLLLKTPTKKTSDDELEKLCPWNPECQDALERMKVEYYKSLTESR